MPAATRHTDPIAPRRFFHAEFFVDGSFLDIHPRLFVAVSANQARQAAAWFGPKGTKRILVELQQEQFDGLCRRYEHVDRDRNWIVVVKSPSDLLICRTMSDVRSWYGDRK